MSVKKNFFYNILLTGSNLLLPLLTFPYLSRVIGAEGLGTCNFVISYCQNYIIIAALGLSMYGTREIAKVGDDIQKRSKLFFELLTIHFLFTVSLLIIYGASLFLYTDFRNYKQLTLMGGLYILLNVFTVEWLFSGVSDFKYITIRSLIVRSLSVLTIFIFVKQKEDFNIYFIIVVSTLLLTVIFNINYARKYITRNIEYSFRKAFSRAKPVFILGIYVVLNSINGQTAPTLLGFLSTKVAVGYFYAADKIIRLTISGFGALTTVMIPKLNLVVEKDGGDEYNLLIHKLLKIVTIFGIPLAFGVFLLAKPLVMLLGGKEFVNSIFCLHIMAPIILIVAFAQIFVLLILNVKRKDKELVILACTGLVIGLLLNIILIPHYAERATAFTQLIVEFSVTTFSFILAKRIFNFKFPVKLVLLNLLFVIPFSLFTYFWMKMTANLILELLLSAITCGLYFLFYQFVIIKDEFLMGLVEPYINKLKKQF